MKSPRIFTYWFGAGTITWLLYETIQPCVHVQLERGIAKHASVACATAIQEMAFAQLLYPLLFC